MTKKKDSAEKAIRDIRRATRRQYSAEEKIRNPERLKVDCWNCLRPNDDHKFDNIVENARASIRRLGQVKQVCLILKAKSYAP